MRGEASEAEAAGAERRLRRRSSAAAAVALINTPGVGAVFVI